MRKNAQEEVKISLKKFNMKFIDKPRNLLFIGKRNTGKSVLVIDFLYYNQDVPFCTCISPTDDFNLTFRPHIPSKFIFDSYSPELIEAFITRQKTLKIKKENAKAGHGDASYRNIDSRGFLIMDDLLADVEQWSKDPNLIWLFTNGRHIDATLIITVQYQLGIKPVMRVNTDFIFICKETKRMESEKLWKHYAGMFQTYDMFLQIFNQVTNNFGCLVIDNTSNSDRLEDQVYTYKAPLRTGNNFHICYAEFWVNNEDYINADTINNKKHTGKFTSDNSQHNYGKNSRFKFSLT